jgi:hypothetical protein
MRIYSVSFPDIKKNAAVCETKLIPGHESDHNIFIYEAHSSNTTAGTYILSLRQLLFSLSSALMTHSLYRYRFHFLYRIPWILLY